MRTLFLLVAILAIGQTFLALVLNVRASRDVNGGSRKSTAYL